MYNELTESPFPDFAPVEDEVSDAVETDDTNFPPEADESVWEEAINQASDEEMSEVGAIVEEAISEITSLPTQEGTSVADEVWEPQPTQPTIPSINEHWLSDLICSGVYACYGAKVKGLSHYKNETNCQDDFLIDIFSANGNEYVIIAVADGHGSHKHYLSEFGAHIAVESTHKVLKQLIAKSLDLNDLWVSVKECFPSMLYSEWSDAVLEDYSRRVPSEQGPSDVSPKEKLVMYGTTAMFCVLSQNTFFTGKIDGNIVAVSTGEIEEQTVDTEDLFGSEAFSLCKRNDALTRWSFELYRDLDFLTISTDGFRNAFGEDDDDTLFHNAIDSLYAYSSRFGAELALQSLPSILSKCSNEASADDVTVCCVVNTSANSYEAENQSQ
ncbi:MAG: protein phosphatase 2C domain-containing protein [Oscillospiraceae bacterium]|nr:protein phosphatase 2C domain-containing protein [Oscillospiraceae bacterium]